MPNSITTADENAQDEASLAAFNALPIRERFASIMAQMLDEFGVGHTPQVRRTISNGMCMCEMFIPAGTRLVGKIHREESFNICAFGDIDIVTEQGFMRVSAGFAAASAPMTQKIGLAHTDTVWVNVFKTNRTSADGVDGIEDEVALTLQETMDFLDPERKYFTKELT